MEAPCRGESPLLPVTNPLHYSYTNRGNPWYCGPPAHSKTVLPGGETWGFWWFSSHFASDLQVHQMIIIKHTNSMVLRYHLLKSFISFFFLQNIHFVTQLNSVHFLLKNKSLTVPLWLSVWFDRKFLSLANHILVLLSCFLESLSSIFWYWYSSGSVCVS